MYPILDELLYNALKNSTEPVLEGYNIRLPGTKALEPHTRYIMIQNSDDELEEDGFDYDKRRIYYILEVGVKKLGYLDAMRLLRNITGAIKIICHTSDDLIYNPVDEEGEPLCDPVDYRGQFRIDKVIPEYGTGNLVKKAHIQLSCSVIEDYDLPEDTFEELDLEAELSD